MDDRASLMEWLTSKDTLLLQDSIEMVNDRMLAFIIDLEPDVAVFIHRRGNLADEVRNLVFCECGNFFSALI